MAAALTVVNADSPQPLHGIVRTVTALFDSIFAFATGWLKPATVTRPRGVPVAGC